MAGQAFKSGFGLVGCTHPISQARGCSGNLSECLGSHSQGHVLSLGLCPHQTLKSRGQKEGRGCGCLEGQELARLTLSRTIRETQWMWVAYQDPVSHHLTTSPSHPPWVRVIMEGEQRQRSYSRGMHLCRACCRACGKDATVQKREDQARSQGVLVVSHFHDRTPDRII